MEKEIKKLFYNWRLVGSTDHRDGGMGEDYDVHTVGISGVKSIEEHPAAGEGDKWYYDIEFNDGSTERIFNPNRVFKF